jgi:hypothetical protein
MLGKVLRGLVVESGLEIYCDLLYLFTYYRLVADAVVNQLRRQGQNKTSYPELGSGSSEPSSWQVMGFVTKTTSKKSRRRRTFPECGCGCAPFIPKKSWSNRSFGYNGKWKIQTGLI